jgi:hypothetical protein
MSGCPTSMQCQCRLPVLKARELDIGKGTKAQQLEQRRFRPEDHVEDGAQLACTLGGALRESVGCGFSK